jgi:HEAT repeat protein
MNQTRILTGALLFATFLLSPFGALATANADDAAKEKELIALLRSDAPKADKALACKHLSVYGSSEAVPELAKLLADEQLASWARIALEVIPGPAADEALRKAMNSLNGKLLVGTINSIGVRRDAGSVEPLIARLKDPDGEVASAAAVALGLIGNAEASKALRGSLATAPGKVRSAVAEACILCAERRLAEGKDAEAVQIYDEVRKAEVPKQRVLEATRGAILARKQDGIALLSEQLRSTDRGLFQIGLSTAREVPGSQVDKALAAELDQAAPERAALIIAALADRQDGRPPEAVVLTAILKAAESGPKPVRLAAIAALGRIGNASCLTILLGAALESDSELAQAARQALAKVPGQGVEQDLLARLDKAEGKMYAVLIELVGARRLDAMPALFKALDHSDRTVRSAALIAVGETVSARNLSALISRVVTPKYAEDAAVAQQALTAACIRMPDREACAAELAAAFDRAPDPTKVPLLQILAAVGGTKALNTLGTAAKSRDPQLQDASSRLLGEWMTIDAGPVLLDLAKTAPEEKYQVRALRGYIRIARQFVMPEPQRVEMCEKALQAARYPAEQKLVLDVLKRYPSAAMLKLAVKASQIPELKEEARQTALAIAPKAGKGADVRDLLTQIGLQRVKLEIVKAEYGAGSNKKDVTETLRRQVEDSPLVSLSSSYNASFGGDPAPGTPKQLTIRYRIDGKLGEASFAEDALILLPVPK